MEVSLRDRIVLITGGARGIGRALVSAFAAEGARVVFTFRSSEESALALESELRARDAEVIGLRVDLKSPEDVERLGLLVETRFGRLDCLVNNAGVVRDNLLLAMGDDEWTDVIETNLSGTFQVLRRCVRLMFRSPAGNIINISSAAASRPGRGQANYAASKGGIESLTKALAVELAPKKVRVNAIAPGLIETDMSADVRALAGDEILGRTLLRRYGRPEDVSAAAVFLASDAASFITGEILHVDGGLKF